MPRPSRSASLALLGACALLAGCGEDGRPSRDGAGAAARAPLPAGARPIGPGPRYHPPLGPPRPRHCAPRLGRRVGAHLELFGDGLVVLFPAGIGTLPPRHEVAGRIRAARCFGDLVTIDPTGLVLLRPGVRATVGDVFAAWGQPLGPRRAASFRGRVRAWVGGRRRRGDVSAIPLRRHAQIVIEVGRYVPPHARYTFPPGY